MDASIHANLYGKARLFAEVQNLGINKTFAMIIKFVRPSPGPDEKVTLFMNESQLIDFKNQISWAYETFRRRKEKIT